MGKIFVEGVGEVEIAGDVPTPEESAAIAGGTPAQSPSIADRALKVATLPHAVGVGAAETLAHLGSGVASSIAGGLTGLGMLQNPQTGIDRIGNTVRQVQQEGTYEPRTQAGQLMTKLATALPELFGKATNWAGEQTTDITGSPLAGAAVNTGLNAAAMALGARVPGVARGVAADASAANTGASALNAVPDAAAAAFKQAGYKGRPSDFPGTPVGSAVEGVAESPTLANKLSRDNQSITNARARKELGLAPDAELSPQSIAREKAAQNKAYEAVRGTGEVTADSQFVNDLTQAVDDGPKSFQSKMPPAFEALWEKYGKGKFAASDAVDAIRDLRKKAGKNIKSQDAATNDLGFAQKKVAAALEAQLERHAEVIGQPELVSALKAARVKLAKLNTVEDALTARGDVSAPILARLAKKGVPLSGELKAIADAYEAFPKVLQDPAKLGATTHGWFGTKTAASKVLASDAYQNTLGPRQYKNPVVAELIGKQNPGAVAAGVGGMTSEDMRRRFLADLLSKGTP